MAHTPPIGYPTRSVVVGVAVPMLVILLCSLSSLRSFENSNCPD